MELKTCPLTGWDLTERQLNPYEIIKEEGTYFYYRVKSTKFDFSYLLTLDLSCKLEKDNNHHYIFRYLIQKGRFSHNFINESWNVLENEPKKYAINTKDFENYISEFKRIPPEEKLNNLLITIYDQIDQKYCLEIDTKSFAIENGFVNEDEFYLFHDSLLENKEITNNGGLGTFIIQLTYKGLNKVIKLKESGKNSKRCFIAMSFDSSLRETREAIRNGIKEAGYDAFFMDEHYPESEQTINDAIISEIKRSRFLVADFTGQNNGAYFEAGYALGRGLKVIYCCEEEDFKKSHFDLKPFSHILYRSTEELQKKLRYKIEAWIE